jgi:hypothetical protein
LVQGQKEKKTELLIFRYTPNSNRNSNYLEVHQLKYQERLPI